MLRAPDDAPLRASALWAMRNDLTGKASTETKGDGLWWVGWDELLACVHFLFLDLVKNFPENADNDALIRAYCLPPIPVLLGTTQHRSPESRQSSTWYTYRDVRCPTCPHAFPAALDGAACPVVRVRDVRCVLTLAKGDPQYPADVPSAGMLRALQRAVEQGIESPAQALSTFG
ncbi:hypothetical protein HYPSUDRAFT_203316 [Hypholoma sublateritium FD-334 SS-4]|uniref:Uncharacterized protein n=1 Tax=Hypholoma sublateritium (strain FD-334 SS-4) TaxID=945553 RepID=A0A0D2L2H7_HYPSF|nr:hypothetical protein HYPSUDRAFT_203316 [Hypholoma sublateritium FD-334 SS-4]